MTDAAVIGETASHTGNASNNKKQQRQNTAAIRQQLQPLRNQIKKLDQKMELLNEEKSQIHDLLTDNTLYEASRQADLQTLLQRQSSNALQLEQLEEQWLAAHDQLETLMADSNIG